MKKTFNIEVKREDIFRGNLLKGDIKGTLIRIRTNLDKLNTIDFDEILDYAKKEAFSKGYTSSPSTASQKLESKKV